MYLYVFYTYVYIMYYYMHMFVVLYEVHILWDSNYACACLRFSVSTRREAGQTSWLW